MYTNTTIDTQLEIIYQKISIIVHIFIDILV